MLVDLVHLIPPWLIAGLLLGGAASLLVASAFYLGNRHLANPNRSAHSRISGSAKRRTEIRRYLRRIDEPFVEDHQIAGGAVGFYLPRRDVAITFDAQRYFRLTEAGTYTVLCEDEMPGWKLGRRLPFEAPTVEPEFDLPDPIDVAFAEFDLARSANESELKAAYRERVKEVHPDQGGDEETFRELREAYATARNYCERRDAA